MSIIDKLIGVGFFYYCDKDVHHTIVKFLNKQKSDYYISVGSGGDAFIADFVNTGCGWIGYIKGCDYILIVGKYGIDSYTYNPHLTKKLVKYLHSGRDDFFDVYDYSMIGDCDNIYNMIHKSHIKIPNIPLIVKLAKVKDAKIDSKEFATVVIGYMFSYSTYFDNYYCDETLVIDIFSLFDDETMVYGYIHNHKTVVLFRFTIRDIWYIEPCERIESIVNVSRLSKHDLDDLHGRGYILGYTCNHFSDRKSDITLMDLVAKKSTKSARKL